MGAARRRVPPERFRLVVNSRRIRLINPTSPPRLRSKRPSQARHSIFVRNNAAINTLLRSLVSRIEAGGRLAAPKKLPLGSVVRLLLIALPAFVQPVFYKDILPILQNR